MPIIKNIASKLFLSCLILSATVFNLKAADYYWVGGTGNWSDLSHHWATTSGGVIFHTTLPGSGDNVSFDANSFATTGDTIFGNLFKMFCNNMRWSGVTNTPVFYVERSSYYPYTGYILDIHGSLWISDSVSLRIPQIDFTSTTAGNTIKSQGQLYDSITINFNGINGEWQLLDSLSGNDGTNLYIINGTFKSNGNIIRCGDFQSSYQYQPTTVQLDSSKIYCTRWIDAGSAICNLSIINTVFNCSYEFYSGSGHTYHYINSDRYCNINRSSVDTIIADAVYCDSCTINIALIKSGFLLNTGTVTNLVFSDSLISIGGGNYFGKVIIPKDANISSAGLIDTLIFNSPGSVITLRDTLTVENVFGFSGTCEKLARIEQDGTYSNEQAVIKKSSGALSLDFIFIKDVAAAGGTTFTATNSFSEGNSPGWNITPITSRNLFWVGDSGNWNDANHWSLNSGGLGGNCSPNLNDSVFFDSNSFTIPNQIVTLDNSYSYCKNLNFTGADAPVFTGKWIPATSGYSDLNTLEIAGSLKLEQGMIFKSLLVNFMSDSTNNFLETAGINLDSIGFSFKGSGSYSLHDSLFMNNYTGISVMNGTFNTNNFNIHCNGISLGWYSNTTIVNLGKSKLFCKEYWDSDTSQFNLHVDSAEFFVEGIFYPGNRHYRNIVCGYAWGGNYSIDKLQCNGMSGSNATVDTLILSNGEMWCYDCDINQAAFHGQINMYYPSTFNKATFDSSAWFRHSAEFDSLLFINPGGKIEIGDSLVVNNFFHADGDCKSYSILKSTNEDSTALLRVPAGTNLNNILIRDIYFTGGVSCTASNSFNEGNVTGITITPPAPRTLYWVGNSGNWNDPNHWSTSSGGIAGSCTPTQIDDVFFDASSFSNGSDTVFVTHDSIFCNNADWTGSNHPVFIGSNKTISIYGSLTLESGMKFLVSKINFKSDALGNTVISKGQTFDNVNINFYGIGEWNLMDSIGGDFGPSFNFVGGTFNTNNNITKCTYLISYGPSNQVILNLGASLIHCHYWTTVGYVIVNTGSAIILCDTTFYTTNGNYNNIDCIDFIGEHSTFNNVSCGDMQLYDATVNSANISGRMYMEFSSITQNLFANNSSNFVNNFYCRSSTINKGVISGPYYIYNDITFDTLILNGSNINMYISGKLNITDKLYINSQADNPAFLFAIYDSAFIHASPNDTICLDYLYLQGMNVNSDSAVFYAGNYSVDLGNNSGWIWSGCTPDTSNVWPGDVNYDLIVDNNDLLYIGVSYGYNGPIRDSASTNWIAQPAVNWLQQFAIGSNIKHADCDGNGIIDANDTIAISLNYGQTHPFRLTNPLPSNNIGTELYFDMPTGSLQPGTVVNIPIMLGTTTYPANNLYGIALTINYDPAFVQPGTMQIDFTNSWLGNNLNTLHLTKDFYSNGTIDMGFVKTDHINTSGNGLFGTLTFTVANNASGFLNLSFSKIFAIDKNEIPIAVNPVAASVFTSINENPALENMISVFPNPVTSILNIIDPNKIIQSIELIDIIGQTVYLNEERIRKTQINTGEFPEGIYILNIKTAKGVLNKKIVIKK